MRLSTARPLLDRVRAVVAEVLWVPVTDIDDDAALVNYGLDSPRAIELTLRLEEEFAVELPEDVAARLDTTAAIAAHFAGELR
ncbi:acyl carrier protein [Mycobacterium sp. Dal123C01]|uniref:acyl carrier protein n=1 Tax=Mycobacterium sp. Dal123C01 TaxID=3457577 RepID=UPI00403ED7B5